MTDEDRQHAIRLNLARMQPGVPADAIPTGSAELDSALGIGGLPRGGIVELFGPVGSGKTSVALAIVAEWQKSGGSAAWIDAERSFDPAYAAWLGVAVEQLPVARPDSAEQAFAMIGQLAATGAVELLVVDSAAALVPALELETPLGESGRGLQSRVLGSGLRKLARTMARTGATTVFLNQTRSRPVPGESVEREELSAGGPALKLYAALRIALEPAAEAGRTRFRILKNKAGEPFREGELRWNRQAYPGKRPSKSP
jgi:recombination protein RecA